MKVVWLICSFIFFGYHLASAQVDTEFWFAAPDPSIADPATENTEIALVISTFGQGADVVIEQPANPAFEAISINIPANTTQNIDLSPQRTFVINRFLNTPLNKGLHITSSEPISAYYEIRHFVNPETFSLKGRNALGTEFFTPFQTTFRKDPANIQGFDVLTTSLIYVVATEDNTLVAIEPTADLEETSATGTINITLNKAETYAISAKGFSISDNFAGSKITASKPVAVTISDDSFYFLEHTGDQLLPTHLLGTRYAAVRGPELDNAPLIEGFDRGPYERMYVVATQDNTRIARADGNGPIYELDAGESTFFEVVEDALLVEGNAPFYAYHFTGFWTEPSATLLPPLDCNGSNSVGFFNSDEIGVYLFLLTRKGNEDSFVLNGRNDLVTPELFEELPGSNGEYVYGEAELFLSDIPEDIPQQLTNAKGFFHLGLMQRSGLSTTYSYLTDFTLRPNLDVGQDTLRYCQGETLTLDAGPQFLSYTWQDGSADQTFTVSEPGLYWVDAFNGECFLRDSIWVIPNEELNFSLGPEEGLTFCDEVDTIISLGNRFDTYLWQDGSTLPFFEIDAPGTYWVTVSNACGTATDTLEVRVSEALIDSERDTCLFAFEPSMTLTPTGNYETLLWEDGSTTSGFTVEQSGSYQVTVSNGCNEAEQAIHVRLVDLAELLPPNAMTPNGDGYSEVFEVHEALLGATLRVHNRWGTTVYENSDYQNQWMATDMPTGTYFYEIDHPCLAEPLKGWVKLMR